MSVCGKYLLEVLAFFTDQRTSKRTQNISKGLLFYVLVWACNLPQCLADFFGVHSPLYNDLHPALRDYIWETEGSDNYVESKIIPKRWFYKGHGF